MEQILKFFKKNFEKKLLVKKIHVFGWQNEYDYILVGSACKYLFEELEIIDNIASLSNDNREGKVKPKYYIAIHDTGDASNLHNAKFWSETVKNEKWELGTYAASYQYVVGNDGIYHNIPDDEIAWHAGDGTSCDYTLFTTDLEGTNEKPKISISDDGFYEIDDKKTIILAPKIYKEKNNKVILDRLAKDSDINDCGIRCLLRNGKYYLGLTYFNTSYEKICNRGGNNNSIGIETCVNDESDIFYTWQKTAKLVAYLLDKYNLSFDDIKQHHYFSGKNCPQTIRVNNMWDYFIDLVKFEFKVLQFIKKGYKFEIYSNDKRVLKNGRISLDGTKTNIEYFLRIHYKNKIVEEKFIINIS